MFRVSDIGSALSELVFPHICPGCDEAGPLSSDGLCPACHEALRDQLGQHYCDRCASSAGPFAANDGRCSVCRGRPWTVAGTARLGPHRGRLRDLLLAFKYGGREELDRFFGHHLGGDLRERPWFEQVEALVAVPTCWHRRALGRPYVATALATEVSRATGLPSLPLLRRIKRERSQIGLSHAGRMKNVRGAFSLARGVELNRAVVCLVDDVATTGATLAECARVLKGAGAAKVFAAVVGKQHTLRGP